jgi:hypothetical protein
MGKAPTPTPVMAAMVVQKMPSGQMLTRVGSGFLVCRARWLKIQKIDGYRFRMRGSP